MRSPINKFMSVDFPTLGLPTIFTKPALCIYLNILWHILLRNYFKLVTRIYLIIKNANTRERFINIHIVVCIHISVSYQSTMLQLARMFALYIKHLLCIISPLQVCSTPCKACTKSTKYKVVTFL